MASKLFVRTLPVMALALFLLGSPAPVEAQGNSPRSYEYRLSWWADDAYYNARPSFTGVDSVWLWTGTCGTAFDPSNRFVGEVSGNLTVLDFILEPDVLNSGTMTDLDLTFAECLPVGEPRLLGIFVVSADGSEQELCFGGAMTTWDCQSIPESHGSAGVGCRAGITPECKVDVCGPIDVVVPESWARVRAKYR